MQDYYVDTEKVNKDTYLPHNIENSWNLSWSDCIHVPARNWGQSRMV